MGKPPGKRKIFANRGFGGILSEPVSKPGIAKMNAYSDLSMKTDEVLRVELEVFRREHRDLDEAISALQLEGKADQLTLQRLKKRKLALKDRIAMIEDRLTPDIIA